MPKYKWLNRWTVGGSALGTLVLSTLLAKDKVAPMYPGKEDIFGQTVIVTGANCGLGRATAQELAKRGGRIIMACRDLEKCEKARETIVKETFNTNVVCKKIDLGSLKSVREFAAEINASEKRLDVLINNAGVMAKKQRQVTEDGFELQLGVNYLGPFLLTTLLLDKLKQSAPSKIINITCGTIVLGKLDFLDFNAEMFYSDRHRLGQSKLALYGFGIILAEILKGTDVSVYTVNPGYCRDTHIHRNTPLYKSGFSSALFYPVKSLMMKTPERGIQTTLYCILSYDPDVTKKSGKYYEECQLFDRTDIKKMDLPRLWAISEHWTRWTET